MKLWIIESFLDAPMEPIAAFRDREVAIEFSKWIDSPLLREVDLATAEELAEQIEQVEALAGENQAALERKIEWLKEEVEELEEKLKKVEAAHGV